MRSIIANEDLAGQHRRVFAGIKLSTNLFFLIISVVSYYTFLMMERDNNVKFKKRRRGMQKNSKNPESLSFRQATLQQGKVHIAMFNCPINSE